MHIQSVVTMKPSHSGVIPRIERTRVVTQMLDWPTPIRIISHWTRPIYCRATARSVLGERSMSVLFRVIANIPGYAHRCHSKAQELNRLQVEARYQLQAKFFGTQRKEHIPRK